MEPLKQTLMPRGSVTKRRAPPGVLLTTLLLLLAEAEHKAEDVEGLGASGLGCRGFRV